MKLKFSLAAALFLAACATSDPIRATILDEQPSAFSAEKRAAVAKDLNLICYIYRNGHFAPQPKRVRTPYTAADFKTLEAMMRKHGLSNRDIELIRQRDMSFGTGQSWKGLTCSLGRVPRVNKAFYPGIGHQWQAVLGSQYVYLRGDGSETGMKVKAWN